MIARLFIPLLALAVLAPASTAAAQDFRRDEGPRNALYLELAGNAFLYSVNMERRVERFWGRVGFGYAQDQDGDPVFGVPVMVSTLWGGGPHYFETGLGVSLARHPGDEEAFLFGSVTLGYRYLAPNGLLIRAGVAPFFDPLFEEIPGVWPAASIGWAW